MAFDFKNPYAPPGVYTETLFESPIGGALGSLNIPMLIGPGNEILSQQGLEVVRGSSAVIDQLVALEDMAGRAVASVDDAGTIILGDWNESLRTCQVRNFPIVTGSGAGATTINPANVVALINDLPIVVLSVDGATGVVELATAPKVSDEVRVSYFFNRTDTAATDDVSDQVSTAAASLRGSAGENFIIEATTTELELTVDGGDAETITFGVNLTGWSGAQIAAAITAAGVGTLTAATYLNYLGETCIILSADQSITIKGGTATTALGFNAGETTSRTKTFHVFQGPIVDGTNGGVTTTTASHVSVTVDGVVVAAASVDGANRAVTLPEAPAAGSTVLVTYKWNSWQDTFDYLANIGVTEVTSAGITTGRTDYVEGVDFVLKDDVLLWGTATIISSGISTDDSTEFGTTQVAASLVDAKTYLEACSPVTDTSVVPPVTSKTTFQLPKVPTSGNGRNSPLGASLFQTVTNSRIDLPTDRPDLVVAYWGFDVQDALDRGVVDVLKVDSSSAEITLAGEVPSGATVFATFYYNVLKDETYTLTCELAGGSGAGTYSVADSDGKALFSTVWGSRGAGLAEDPVFPSGSVLMPDARHEAVGGDIYTGPVEEDVTVTFTDKDPTPAKWTFPGPGPFYFAAAQSSTLTFNMDAGGANNLNLVTPSVFTGARCGSTAVMLGSEVQYENAAVDGTVVVTGTNDGLQLSVDGVDIDVTAASGGTDDLDDYVTVLNAESVATAAEYTAAGKFTSWTVTAGEYDTITVVWTGGATGAGAPVTGTLTPATYATPTDLATEVQAQIVAALTGGYAAGAFPAVTVTASLDGELVFSVTTGATDTAGGVFEFVGDSGAADFCMIAGIDCDTGIQGAQTKILAGCPIARRFTVAAATGGELHHDRLLIRSRLLLGANTVHPSTLEGQSYVKVVAGNGCATVGLTVGETAWGSSDAVVRPATVAGNVGWSDGQTLAAGDASDGQPIVVLYDGTDPTNARNDEFDFNIDGVPVKVDFTSTDTGTDTPLGPGGVAGTVMIQIATAIAAVHPDYAGAANVISAGIVTQEGSTLRITSALSSASSSVSVGTGNANVALGIADNTSASRGSVPAHALANAINCSEANMAWAVAFTPPAGEFPAECLAAMVEADDGSDYVFIQSQTTGVSSSIAVVDSTALRHGTGLLAVAADGAVGEAGISGFVVSSSNSVGSGSADDSVLSLTALGSDGTVGQTYRDAVTGLTFTVLPLEGGNNYTDGATAIFTFEVRAEATCDANIPVFSIPGISLVVANTTGTTVGDTALIENNERGGAEPAIGDVYYVNYEYSKRNYSPSVYTKLSSMERAFGAVGPNSPTSLAGYLAFLNGAVVIGVKQVKKVPGETNATEATYTTALDDLEGLLPGRIRPSVLLPLIPHSIDLAAYLSVHCAVQSDIKHRAERTAILGFEAGTQPTGAQDAAKSVADTRIRLMYPDMMTITTTDAFGRDTESLIDGRYLAVMMGARQVAPNRDVATPWTGVKFVGTNGLSRVLDPVSMNQTAAAGVTVCEDRPPFIAVRHGLTTDMSSVMTKTPTVIQIADEVQQQSRDVLEAFIGVKFLPQILTQVEGRLAMMFKAMVSAQICGNYTGIRASVNPDDPTAAAVEAFYTPIFPLLYIVLTFNIRASL
jgi:hypothetical protein